MLEQKCSDYIQFATNARYVNVPNFSVSLFKYVIVDYCDNRRLAKHLLNMVRRQSEKAKMKEVQMMAEGLQTNVVHVSSISKLDYDTEEKQFFFIATAKNKSDQQVRLTCDLGSASNKKLIRKCVDDYQNSIVLSESENVWIKFKTSNQCIFPTLTQIDHLNFKKSAQLLAKTQKAEKED